MSEWVETFEDLIVPRLAELFVMTPEGVLEILNSLDGILNAVIAGNFEPGETERRIAAKFDKPLPWVENFLDEWERIATEVEHEVFEARKK